MSVLTDKKWNPEHYYALALDTLSEVNSEDARAWRHHPCTQHLLYSLTGDVAGLIQGWVSGQYTDKSIEATAQENAKRIGQVQTLEDLIELIEMLGKNIIRGEENDRAIGTYSDGGS